MWRILKTPSFFPPPPTFDPFNLLSQQHVLDGKGDAAEEMAKTLKWDYSGSAGYVKLALLG